MEREELLFEGNKTYEKLLRDIIDKNNSETDLMNSSLHLSLKKSKHEDGQYSAEFNFSPVRSQLNPFGEVHGGIVCSVFDTCAGYTASAARYLPVTTTDLSVSYLRALLGKSFTIRVELTHVGIKMISGLCKIFNDETEELCSTASCTYMALPLEMRRIKV